MVPTLEMRYLYEQEASRLNSARSYDGRTPAKGYPNLRVGKIHENKHELIGSLDTPSTHLTTHSNSTTTFHAASTASSPRMMLYDSPSRRYRNSGLFHIQNSLIFHLLQVLNQIPDNEADYHESYEDGGNTNRFHPEGVTARGIKSGSNSSSNFLRKSSNSQIKNKKFAEYEKRFEKPKPKAPVVSLNLKQLTNQLNQKREVEGQGYNITLAIDQRSKLLLS